MDNKPISDPQNGSSYSLANPNVNSVVDNNPAQNDNQRVLLRQSISGSQRGNWDITGSINITSPITNKQVIQLSGTDSSIVVTNTDGSKVGMGAIPDGSGEFGFFTIDSMGNLLYKIVGSTIYAYDPTQTPAKNVIQLLKLPDGTYGFAIAKPGSNVSDGLS